VVFSSIAVCLLLPGTYLETDFDRSVTRDISILSRTETPRITVQHVLSPVEHDLADMLRQSPRLDRGLSPYRRSQVPSAGHSGGRNPDKTSELTGGRYPAYRSHAPQPTSRSSPQSKPQQQQQWYRHSVGQPRNEGQSWNVPRRSGSEENVLRPHVVNLALSSD